jgi:biotin carboxylase
MSTAAMTEAVDLAGSRLLVLGAGRHQETLIRRAEERGVAVVAVDYFPDAPGKAHASHPELADALDIPANIELGERYRVDGVVTLGTDQTVLTMATVAETLGLPCYITADNALRATDKSVMAAAYAAHDVPRPRFVELADVTETAATTRQMTLPVAVKPADSQGQRATVRVDHRSGLAPAVANAIAESRTGRAIVDQWVTGPEVTVSAWVSAGEPHILMVADRITINPPPTIGVAFQHVFPSLAAVDALPEIERQIAAITRAYGMHQGPLYVQMIVNGGEVVTIEGGARVGGGHEVGLTPIATGVDVVDRLIDLALTGQAESVTYHYGRSPVSRHALVNFLIAAPGVVGDVSGFPGIVDDGLAAEGGFYIGPGYTQPPITNSLGRLGYFIATGATRAEMMARAREAYGRLSMTSDRGEEMLFWPDPAIVNDAVATGRALR